MNKMNCLVGGLTTLAFIVLSPQCAGKADSQVATTPASANAELSRMKITYVEIDILLVRYNFCIDLNEAVVRKGENVRMTLNQKMTVLNKEEQEFQKKYENNAFPSPERAQQEYDRSAKMEQDLQGLSSKLQNGPTKDDNANSLLFRSSISTFLKGYDKTHGYSLIFSSTGFDNLLYVNSAYSIIKEIVDRLNVRYSSAKK